MNLEQNFIKISNQIDTTKQCYDATADLPHMPSKEGKIRLLAVSKKKPAEMIRRLWHVGQRDFGENYVQEAIEKMVQLKDLEDISWHLTGPVQSNKTRLIAEHFDWVQTIDREKIAKRLNDQRPATKKPLNVCIQVNISEQTSKSGVNKKNAFALAHYINTLPRLCLRGVMTIPATVDFSFIESVEKLRTEFKMMYTLYCEFQGHFTVQNIDTLSMGMSQDMNIALEEGSTCVRIGTALFGHRPS